MMRAKYGLNITDCIDDLKQAGFELDKAEAITKAFTKLSMENIEVQEFANRQDLYEIESKLENKISSLEVRITNLINTSMYKTIGLLAALQALFHFIRG